MHRSKVQPPPVQKVGYTSNFTHGEDSVSLTYQSMKDIYSY